LRHQGEQLELHWRQQREGAHFHTERVRRQYDAVEPENRLVACELERRWEDALREEQRLAEDYARFCQNQPVPLSDADHERLTALASDIPALWATAGPVDRQTIIRHLVERVEVDVADYSELVAVNIRWVGGGTSQHTLLRPVGQYERLRDF